MAILRHAVLWDKASGFVDIPPQRMFRTLQRLLIFFFLASFWLAGCGGAEDAPPPAPPSDRPTEQNAANPSAPLVIVAEDPTPDPSLGLAAQVNDQPISLEAVERQLIFLGADPDDPQDRAASFDLALEQRINQALIQQGAAELGVIVPDEVVQAELAALEAEANAQGFTLDEFFAMQGISAEDYPQQIYEAMLAVAVNEIITSAVPTQGPQVRARHILVADEASARQILALLNAGESFESLAAQYSLDPSTREAGGDLGWISPGDLLQEEVEAVVFTVPANSRAPEPVQSILGYHIIEVLERAESRELQASSIAERRERVWLEWLAEQRAAASIQRYISP